MKLFECLRTKFSLRAKSEISREGGSVLLKAPYNKDISTKWFQKQLQRHLALLQQVVPSCPVRPCWSVRKRLFRSSGTEEYGRHLKVKGVDEVRPYFFLCSLSLVLHVVASRTFAPFAAV